MIGPPGKWAEKGFSLSPLLSGFLSVRHVPVTNCMLVVWSHGLDKGEWPLEKRRALLRVPDWRWIDPTLKCGRQHKQDVNKEDVRTRTNETETMGAVEKEKVQCSSGHWERCLGQFLNKVAGNCTHFAEVIKGAIKVGTGKKLYSVVICPGWSKIEENWFAELMTSSSNKRFIRLTP